MLAVGTIVWLGSELMFFGGLFAAYFTLRSLAESWPPPGIRLETGPVTIFTIVLVLSSGTMHVAHGALAAGDTRRLRVWLAATLVLGALFVANQAREFATLEYSISTGAYGSIYYLMVGFHALHVAGGLALLALTLARTSGGRVAERDADMVEATSYYWHFVDVVWIGMFTTIFVLR
jgi:cytochrome c oxidase subunit III